MAKVNYRGVILDSRTARMMDIVALRTQPKIVPTQGSFSTDVKASGHTHDGSGAIDLSVKGLTNPRANSIVKVMRQVGFAAWHRLKSDGFDIAHIHGIAVDSPGLSPAAANQVDQLRNGEDGLKNAGPDPHAGMHLPVISFETFLAKTNTGAVVDLSDVIAQVTKTGEVTAAVSAALVAMGLEPTRAGYAQVQQILGFSGQGADGIPGGRSLRRLGDAFGFTVKL